MSKIIGNDIFWPLGLMIAHGEQSLDHHKQMIEIWDDWFERAEKFHVLRVYQDADSLKKVPGVAKASKLWLRAGAKEKIKLFVSSMLIVVPPDSFENVQHLSIEKVFHVPGGIFSSVADAVNQLDKNGGLFPHTLEEIDLLLSQDHIER